ncbi:MAG: TetR/AcrR family transcriptional regulator [Pseudomonadota bacterium]
MFRRYGYQGATTKLLAEASGLGKSSLYHHFPSGKEDMALAVVAKTQELLFEQLMAPLAGDPGDKEIGAFVALLERFYRDGRLGCVIATLSLGDCPKPVARAIKSLLEDWIDAVARVSDPPGERATAVRIVRAIQGGLVLGLAAGKPAYFADAMQDVAAMLYGSSA